MPPPRHGTGAIHFSGPQIVRGKGCNNPAACAGPRNSKPGAVMAGRTARVLQVRRRSPAGSIRSGSGASWRETCSRPRDWSNRGPRAGLILSEGLFGASIPLSHCLLAPVFWASIRYSVIAYGQPFATPVLKTNPKDFSVGYEAVKVWALITLSRDFFPIPCGDGFSSYRFTMKGRMANPATVFDCWVS